MVFSPKLARLLPAVDRAIAGDCSSRSQPVRGKRARNPRRPCHHDHNKGLHRLRAQQHDRGRHHSHPHPLLLCGLQPYLNHGRLCMGNILRPRRLPRDNPCEVLARPRRCHHLRRLPDPHLPGWHRHRRHNHRLHRLYHLRRLCRMYAALPITNQWLLPSKSQRLWCMKHLLGRATRRGELINLHLHKRPKNSSTTLLS